MKISAIIFYILKKIIPRYRQNFFLKKLDKVSIIYHALYENANYEIESNGEKYIIERLTQSENLNCLFDVGANKGSYSKMVREINNNCDIHAFEPVQKTYNELIMNTKGLNIILNNFGLGNFEGKAEILMPINSSQLATFLRYEWIEKELEAIKKNVFIKKGSDYIFKKNIDHISFLKIDTEGYENQVLAGMGESFDKIDVIQFEYGKPNIYAKYYLLDYFKDYSSRFFIGKLYPKGVNFFAKYNSHFDDFLGGNFIMVNRRKRKIKEILSLDSF